MRISMWHKGLGALMGFVLAGCSPESDLSWAKVEQENRLWIGMTGSNEPMNGYDPIHDHESGFEVEMAKELCRRLGVKPQFKRIFWLEKIIELNTHQIDCIWSVMTITSDRQERVLFTEPYLISHQIALVRADSPFWKVEELQGQNVGYLKGSSVFHELEKRSLNGWHMNLSAYPQFELGLMQLALGTEQAMVMDEVLAWRHVQKNQTARHPLRILQGHFGVDSLAVAFRRNDRTLHHKVQVTLRAMEQDGYTAQLREKWFGSHASKLFHNLRAQEK